MAPKKLTWEKIVPETHFRFSPPKAGAEHGGLSVNVDVFDEETGKNLKFIHQAPPLSLPFGLQTKETKDVNGKVIKTRVVATFSFPTIKKDQATGEFRGDPITLAYLNFLQSIETFNKKKAFEQCKMWFKKEMKENVIDEFYFSAVFCGEKVLSGEYPPLFTCKITEEPNRWATKFIACQEVPGGQNTWSYVPMAEVPKSRKVIPLLEVSSLWFAGKQFGMSFKVVQLAYFDNDEFSGLSIDLGAAADYVEVPRGLADRPEEVEEEATLAVKRKAESETEKPANKVATFNFPEPK